MTGGHAPRYRPASDLLAGRVVLVTGAGAGVGRTAALAYARHGADIVLLGRTRSKLEAVFDLIVAETPTKPVIVPADLATLDEAAADNLAEAIRDDYGRLDGILHNASVLGPRVPVAHYPADAWAEVMQVNAMAPVLLTRALLPLLEAAPEASIVFTSSGVGRVGRAYWGAYAVSKFATEGLSQTLADELEHTGVRVNALNPGGTRTAMRAAAYPAEDPATLPEPEAHMDLYLYLMGPDSAGVTGRSVDAPQWRGP